MSSNDNNNLSEHQTKLIKEIDYEDKKDNQSDNNEYTRPQNRFFNGLMTLLFTVSSICIGVIVGVLITHFSS